jgi:hypothetical protein
MQVVCIQVAERRFDSAACVAVAVVLHKSQPLFVCFACLAVVQWPQPVSVIIVACTVSVGVETEPSDHGLRIIWW